MGQRYLSRAGCAWTIPSWTSLTSSPAGGACAEGDEVVLIGRQGGRELSAEEVGRRLGTINYDVVSRILARVPRILVDRETI